MRRELVGPVAAPARVCGSFPVVLLLGVSAVVGLNESEERRDPAGDVRSARFVLVLVDRTPETLVGRGARRGFGDGSKHGEQVVEVVAQVGEVPGEHFRTEEQVLPVLRLALQLDLRDTAARGHHVLVVRAGHIHERHQQRRLVLDGRG